MKIIRVNENSLEFDNGKILYSLHEQDCCEEHYADFESIIGQGWEDADFDDTLMAMLYEIPEKRYHTEKMDTDEFQTFFSLIDKNKNKYIINIYNSNNGYYDTTVMLEMYDPKTNFKEKILIQEYDIQ